jgi:hypothetical protein
VRRGWADTARTTTDRVVHAGRFPRWAGTAHPTIVEMSVPDISPSPSAAGLDGNEDDGDDPNGMLPALCSADAKSAESAKKVCGSGDPEFYLAPVVRSRLLAKNRPNETPAIHVGIANKGKIQSGIERKRRSLRSAKNKGSIQKMAPPTNSPETIKVNREVKTAGSATEPSGVQH